MGEFDPNSRTFVLPRGVLASFVEVGEAVLDNNWQESDCELLPLPPELTEREVRDVSIQVENRAELNRPSRDGYSRGRKVAQTALSELGVKALFEGDLTTAQNVRSYLKSARTLRGLVNGYLIGREIRQYQKDIA